MNTRELDVITWLRFPLMVGVVCVHCYLMQYHIETSPNGYTFMGGFQYLFSQIIGRLSTSLFFLFSGYVFFYKVEYMNIQTYRDKIKKRIRSLLLPYIIWNSLFLLFNYTQQVIGGYASTANFKIVADYNLTDWILAFWNGTYGYPVNPPLWFIRDLMVIVLFTPLIYWLLKFEMKYFRHISPICILLGVGYCLNISELNAIIPCMRACFFFTLGAAFSIRKTSFIPSQTIIGWILTLSYIVIVVLKMIFYSSSCAGLLGKIGQIVGVFAVIYLTSLLTDKNKKMNKYVESSSFFIYLTHIMSISLLLVLCEHLHFPLDNQWFALGVYIALILLTVFICVTIYNLMKRFLPKTTTFLLGGR